MLLSKTCFKEEVIADFAVQDQNSNKVVIILPGLPGSPMKNSLLTFFAERWYWTFLLRYRWSWESGWRFLEHSPSQDVLDIVDSLESGFVNLKSWTLLSIKNPKVCIIGSSFGWTMGLFCSTHPNIVHVFANAPVLNWLHQEREESLSEVERFLINGFPFVYRFFHSDWEKFSRGEMCNPYYQHQEIDFKKVTIFYAEDDPAVSIKSLYDFMKIRPDVQAIVLKDGGHLHTNRFTEPFWFELINSKF